ncbi:MAG: sigma-54-dependent Fis family transcriptional regulator, partial [Nitrospirae bacterium]|nr:sigma-54-dependent Fis family transcriptional regulator [Nitrospirota bacterium]
MDERILGDDDFIRKLFDAIPSILLLTDDDVRVLGLNVAASQLLGAGIDDIYNQRGGDVLHCIHAGESPDGCGHAEDCKECVIRNSV